MNSPHQSNLGHPFIASLFMLIPIIFPIRSKLQKYQSIFLPFGMRNTCTQMWGVPAKTFEFDWIVTKPISYKMTTYHLRILLKNLQVIVPLHAYMYMLIAVKLWETWIQIQGKMKIWHTLIAHTLRHLRLRLMLGVCRWFRCKRWTIQHSYQRPQLSSRAQRRDRKAGMEYWLQGDTVLVTRPSYTPRNLWICGENLIEDLTPTVSQAPRYALHSHVSLQCGPA